MKEILMVPIEKIVANPYQPRIEFNEESLMDLAQSIRENGLIQPVTLKEKDGATEIITLDRSILGDMIMLHKAKGGLLFKIMMVLYGIVLIGFYISGLVIAVFKKNVNGKLVPKTESYVVIAAGFIVTIIFAIISL